MVIRSTNLFITQNRLLPTCWYGGYLGFNIPECNTTEFRSQGASRTVPSHSSVVSVARRPVPSPAVHQPSFSLAL